MHTRNTPKMSRARAEYAVSTMTETPSTWWTEVSGTGIRKSPDSKARKKNKARSSLPETEEAEWVSSR